MKKKSELGWRNEFKNKLGQVFSVSNYPYSVKLDQNESAVEMSESVKCFLLHEMKKIDWRRYPQADLYKKAKEGLARYLKIDPEEIMITSGGDQVIQALFIVSKPKVLIFEPTYPMYRLFAQHSKKKAHIEVLGPEFKINPKIFQKGFDLVNIVSPNNPTGNIQSKKIVFDALAKSGLVLVDEAYFEFSDWTMINDFRKHRNLFIARTFSKALSMSGLRMGYCISHKDNIKILESIMFSPYNVNILTLTICKNINKICKYIDKIKKIINEQRPKLEQGLKDLRINFIKSQCNFISFQGDKKLYDYLTKEGVRVRDVSPLPGMDGYLRVTIGTGKENKIFLKTLADYFK